MMRLWQPSAVDGTCSRALKWRSTPRAFSLTLLPVVAVFLALFTVSASGSPATPCTGSVLAGSNFEIDADANLKVDGTTQDCIDWNSSTSNTTLRSGVVVTPDKPTGSGDDSFGQGTSEDDANPTIVSGSIPPNKSDLKLFGAYTETTSTAKYLQLFWSRVQDPSGTTNMDFELNQKFCDPTASPKNCADNGAGVTPETPVRTAGDKLITYDLAGGGTVPTISIRTWGGAAWGPPTVLSGGAGMALGSVNTSAIVAPDSGIGAQDPFTFGEASISFSALFPSGTGCGTFGSVYLKSRSSTSFSSEVKDFVSPGAVSISNCTSLTTTAHTPATIGDPIHDVAHLSGATTGAGGTITFHLYSDAACQNQVATGLSPVPVSGNGDYNSGNFTPAAVGSYYWTASYSGDINNTGSSTACGDPDETSVVQKATPTLTTTAQAAVLIGAPIYDVAHLGAGTNDIGGSIVFSLYSDVNCKNQIALTPAQSTVAVNGNGDYQSGNYVPTAPGTYYWTASYSGDAKNQAISTACNDANESSFVLAPHISVSKTPASQTILGGSSASFTIEVTNDGNVLLTDVRVTDALAPGCDRTSLDIPALGLMAPGAHVSYQCSLASVSTSFTNVAVATGTPPVGPDVSASDSADVVVINPHIKISKTPATQTMVSGSSASFTIEVTNDGDATLTDVHVSDALSPVCDRTKVDIPALASMAPGDQISYQCSLANVTTGFTNVAVAAGTPPVGPDVSANASADVVVINPHIKISKTPATQTIVSGTSASFTIEVTNDGDATLTDVHVTDVQAPGCDRAKADIAALASMAPGDHVSYQCALANVTASFTNVAVATGTPPVGPDVTANDSADVVVIAPHIKLTKKPASQTVVSGTSATFTIEVTNDGNATLTDVHVADVLSPSCDRTKADIAALASMAPGDQISYQCTLASATASFTNIATATGTPPIGPDVTSTDSADVIVINPHIKVSKKPGTQTIVNGSTATFDIEVTNDGDSTLTDVHVTDALAPGCARTKADIQALASMAAGDHVNYQCSLANVTSSFTNVATAIGTPAAGPDVTAQDSARVTVINPHITVSKTPHSQTITSGDSVTFTIEVKNDGDATLTDVNVTDALALGCSRTKADIPALASMAAGDHVNYQCTLANVTGSFTNVATATGTPPVGPNVSGSDSADVVVITPPSTPAPKPVVANPQIQIVKNPKAQTVAHGGTATFTITVTNSGNVVLTNVSVADAFAPDCNRAIGTLSPGATVTYTCSRRNVTASFTNVAVATGTGAGTTVTATDSAHVTAGPFKPKKKAKKIRSVISHRKPKATG
jgi:uncharacterized repeat protein (TIGR01451 family)